MREAQYSKAPSPIHDTEFGREIDCNVAFDEKVPLKIEYVIESRTLRD